MFTIATAMPHGSDGVNDMPRFEAVALRDLGLACLAAVKHSAFRHEFRSRRAVDRAIHAATAEKRCIGGIHDGIDVQGGDVGLDDGNSW